MDAVLGLAVTPVMREHLGEVLRETYALAAESHHAYERMTLADENTDRLRHDLTMLTTYVARLAGIVASLMAPDLLTTLDAAARYAGPEPDGA